MWVELLRMKKWVGFLTIIIIIIVMILMIIMIIMIIMVMFDVHHGYRINHQIVDRFQ